MKHDSYVCPPHCYEGCDCDDPENSACNPYWLPGFCPTDGEGTECLATRTAKDYLAEGPPWMHAEDEGVDYCEFCKGSCTLPHGARLFLGNIEARPTIIVAGVEVEL